MAAEGSVTEIADRAWLVRHEYLQVNSTVIGGDRGLLVVDTLWSERAAGRLLEQVRALAWGDVVAVVNTHHHFDHVLGNATFSPHVAEHVAHEAAAAEISAHGASVQAQVAADPAEPYGEEIASSSVALPTRTFSSVHVVDLGDRIVELVHPGRGHTSGDVVVRVPDADLLLAGDLVEESGPPGFGPDCFVLEWPATLDFVVELLGPGSVVVPGHGAPVDRDFVTEQRNDIGTVAETIFDLASRSVPLQEAERHQDWPYPADHLRDAVRRGYDQVPRTERRLPLA